MKIKTILWLATAALVVASIIDIVDGYIPKIISSTSIAIALASLALGQSTDNRKIYNWIACVFILVALLSFTYRFLIFYNIYR